METALPKYPFGPLPLPESPNNRQTGHLTKNRSVESEKVSSNHATRRSFKSALDEQSKILRRMPAKADEMKQLKKAAEDLEAYFLYSIMKKFDSANIKSGLFKESTASKIYMDMFFEKVADEMVKGGNGIGLGDSIINSAKASISPSDILELNNNIQQIKTLNQQISKPALTQ